MYEIKIPLRRVGCLIGKNGEKKRLIERSTKTRLRVSVDGDVKIVGEGVDAYLCEKVVSAIGRGVNPDVALNLLKDDYTMEIVDIKNLCGRNKKKFLGLKQD